jgi:xanthine/CO dehydrogenase XdhC/CoxF family maturation factor
MEHIPLDGYTAVIGMFHDYKLDRSILEWALAGDPGYTGLLGPRKRFDRMSRELKLSEEVRSRIHSPVGLDLGAVTPEEIAVSIVSGVIAHFRGGAGEALREKDGPIHRRRGHTIN